MRVNLEVRRLYCRISHDELAETLELCGALHALRKVLQKLDVLSELCTLNYTYKNQIGEVDRVIL